MALSSLGLAQASAPDAGSPDSSSVAGELKTLREAMVEQQKQIARQQQQIEKLQQQLGARQENAAAQSGEATPRVVDAALHTAGTASLAVQPASDAQDQPADKSPLSVKIGGAEFTPGGFLDLTGFWRSTNPGSGYGTNFFSIPYNNTIPGQLTETRFTAENSRISLKATDTFKGNDVTGYFETDFHGNDPANLSVSTNSSTLRLRQYWVDVKRGPWEILGGQAWSFLTPNRVGVSSNPSDLFYTQNVDANYQLGLTWTRAPQFRVVYHANDHWALGVAFENPDQSLGQAGQSTLPAGLAVVVATQLDVANNTVATPNLMPDILPKIAYDTDLNGKHFHVEAVGLATSARVLPALGGTSNTKIGGGGSFAVNLEVVKNLRLVSNVFLSDGGGRYIFGSGPQVVVTPAGQPSFVHADSGIGGFEYQISPKTMLAAYYGGAYFQRNFFLDTSAGAKANSFVGFGGPGSSNAANRAIQEGTIDWVTTMWKNPQYGALQLLTQYSYLTRAPWVVAAGAPKNARSGMVWVNLRYVLP